MPAVSDPRSSALPRTWRPFGTRIAGTVAGGGLVAVCVGVAIAFGPELRAEFTIFQRLTLIVLGGMLTLNDGTLPSFLAEQFPTTVRYSGFAVSFNLANALFGGTAPMICTWLIAQTGSDLAPGWYLMAAAVVSLVAILFAKETSRQALRHS